MRVSAVMGREGKRALGNSLLLGVEPDVRGNPKILEGRTGREKRTAAGDSRGACKRREVKVCEVE